jgi:hypothetical protein
MEKIQPKIIPLLLKYSSDINDWIKYCEEQKDEEDKIKCECGHSVYACIHYLYNTKTNNLVALGNTCFLNLCGESIAIKSESKKYNKNKHIYQWKCTKCNNFYRRCECKVNISCSKCNQSFIISSYLDQVNSIPPIPTHFCPAESECTKCCIKITPNHDCISDNFNIKFKSGKYIDKTYCNVIYNNFYSFKYIVNSPTWKFTELRDYINLLDINVFKKYYRLCSSCNHVLNITKFKESSSKCCISCNKPSKLSDLPDTLDILDDIPKYNNSSNNSNATAYEVTKYYCSQCKKESTFFLYSGICSICKDANSITLL